MIKLMQFLAGTLVLASCAPRDRVTLTVRSVNTPPRVMAGGPTLGFLRRRRTPNGQARAVRAASPGEGD